MQVTASGTFLGEVAEIERLQPDFILMALRRDGTQPRLWTCVQHLKSHQATKDIPVVLYNGYSLAIVDLVLEQEPRLPWGIDPPGDHDEFVTHMLVA